MPLLGFLFVYILWPLRDVTSGVGAVFVRGIKNAGNWPTSFAMIGLHRLAQWRCSIGYNLIEWVERENKIYPKGEGRLAATNP